MPSSGAVRYTQTDRQIQLGTAEATVRAKVGELCRRFPVYPGF